MANSTQSNNYSGCVSIGHIGEVSFTRTHSLFHHLSSQCLHGESGPCKIDLASQCVVSERQGCTWSCHLPLGSHKSSVSGIKGRTNRPVPPADAIGNRQSAIGNWQLPIARGEHRQAWTRHKDTLKVIAAGQRSCSAEKEGK